MEFSMITRIAKTLDFKDNSKLWTVDWICIRNLYMII